MPPSLDETLHNPLGGLGANLGGLFDPAWYRMRYPDVQSVGTDPLHHFLTWGAAEGRDPNRWFDGAWYQEHYPDVAASGLLPLVHYLQCGAPELRNPHPRFDAAWYADQHPEGLKNPLLHHLRFGAARGWLTEKPIDIRDYLPSKAAAFVFPGNVRVDIVVPVYRGLAETQRCLESVLADPNRPSGRIIVVDDCSPEPGLAGLLAGLATAGHIMLLRNRRNLGFVASVNRGMQAAGTHDVALLNSDTEVPAGWLRRLAANAYAGSRIASVSPFSNNATICGYPGTIGGPMPFDMSLQALDAACHAVNAGRQVEVPTTVGFCMYIRRDALDDVGLFDEKTFGKGYGEENDFCMRASARGWHHMLACDTFVYHEGAVSFGAGSDSAAAAGLELLVRRYPQYRRIVAQHVKLDAAGPSRFAVTIALFHRSKLPVLLMLSHGLGGGVDRHIDRLVQHLAGRAHVLLLRATTRGASLTVAATPDHPDLVLPEERIADLVTVLRAFPVVRAHVHHLLGMDLDARTLLHRLNVPFDVTVHDYFALCPQVNMLPWKDSFFCGEPGPATCNACIADSPSHGARDILAWRGQFTWLFQEAERVICPSRDVRDRLVRFGVADRAIVVPHEPVAPGPWPIDPPPLQGGKLRVALLGVLAPHKGMHPAISVIEAADPTEVEFHLIGHPEEELPPSVVRRIKLTGQYDEGALPELLARVKPHLAWLPAQWPETYSYTLSAAITAGLPVVASNIGAFPERIEGRPLSFLVDPRAAPEEWLAAFQSVRTALQRPLPRKPPQRPPLADFYARDYLPETVGTAKPRRGPIDLRRLGRTTIVVIPERFDSGALTPCAYIRLLLPLNHPEIARDFDVVLADAEDVARYRADIIVTQRYAIPTLATADALIAHCRETGAKLLYDIDDDLLHIPRNHADAAELRPKTKLVQRLLRGADAVWTSTPTLADSLAALRSDIRVVPNGLDERIWCDLPPDRRRQQGPVRILCMGTATHDADFAIIEPALARLKQEFGDRVSIDMLGVTTRAGLPDWIHRPGLPITASGSYPGFVTWLTAQPAWDIGLAPLADTAFNRCKSALKALDYAAIGLAVLVSEGPVYRGSLADGPGGLLVANRPEAWYAAMSRLVRDGALRRRLGQAAMESLRASGTLSSQAAQRREAWQAVARMETATARPRRNGSQAAAA